jgi:2-methylisocitrate lyase-like PEP mutase family enzyme
MPTQSQKSANFEAFHVKGDPLILYNIWDAGSARVVEKAGAKALATGSRSVAGALGYDDGEQVPLDIVHSCIEQIVRGTNLPVTLDFEGAYSADPTQVGAHAKRVFDTGIVGFNFEDQIVGTNEIYTIEDQCARITAMREACGSDAFINARTDVFLKAEQADHNDELVDHAIERGLSYHKAGASGFFIPALFRLDAIARVCEALPIPVNVMAHAAAPGRAALKGAGVARISYGPMPWNKAMAFVEENARAAFAD